MPKSSTSRIRHNSTPRSRLSLTIELFGSMKVERNDIEEEFPSSNDISQLSDFNRGRRTSCHAVMRSDTSEIGDDNESGADSSNKTGKQSVKKG